MSKIAVEIPFGGLTTATYPSGYDKDKLNLGPLMIQKNDSGNEGKYVGPLPTAIIRPMEYSTTISAFMPWAMQWSSTIDWVFFVDNAAAGVSRRVMYATYNRTTGAFNIQGFVTLTYPTATNHTVRAFRMTYDKYTTGTVAVSGTAVTGSSTTWSADRMCVGSRIGFGSTDPTQISTWYEISAVGSDTGITLTTSAGTIGSGTSYVIEDLRAITVTTNATATNGGVYVTKGLKPEIFIPSGTTISAASATDNIRAVYWLADASTVTNTVTLGAGIEGKTDWTNQTLWVLDTVANPILFKYNIRRALTLSSGKDTGSLIFKTGAGGALTGTASQVNNGRLATLSHGPGSGLSCLYWTTTTRIYRSVALSTITTGSTSWVADAAVEVPPGGTNTYAASSLMNSVEYMNSIDKFIVPVNATTTPFRSYVTQYRTDSGQFDRFVGNDIRQTDLSTADNSTTPVPATVGSPYTVWVEGGLAYLATIGTTSITNRIYAIPFGADWEYLSSTNAFIVTPRIACPNIDKFVRVYINAASVIGGTSDKNLGVTPEPFRIKYRTSGIDDDSGSWTTLDQSGELSGVAGATYIQFRIEFRTIGLTGVMPRIYELGVIYEDLSTDSHYQPSVGRSNISTSQFAWRFSTAFGGTVPTLRVRLYDAVSGSLLVDDTTATSASGTFGKSTNNGDTWGSYNTTDKGNETTYIRYIPSAIGSNIKVRALLTLA